MQRGQAVRRRRAGRSDAHKLKIRRSASGEPAVSHRVAKPEKVGKSSKVGTGQCRLCSGEFSIQRLRRVFGKPHDSDRFSSDFHHLLGVPVIRDPALPQFICKTCHAQFYKCLSILTNFRERVNLTPNSSHMERISTKWPSMKKDKNRSSPLIASDPRCLRSLVSWTHQHAESCSSCPGLKEVLEGQCWGSVKAVWRCVDGHSYVMDTGLGVQRAGGIPSLIQAPPTDQSEESDLSDSSFSSDDDNDDDDDDDDDDDNDDDDDDDRSKSSSSDDSTDLYPDKRLSSSKKASKDSVKKTVKLKILQPKERKKPGPKPGWKRKLKTEREDLPTVYKCPHQGCTAVYRGPDGMKKHIKEHHEEVRERPCPHPGCNKVFMIDRYLQRHVKLIHTEVRNYVCDQCGQTFKQRKHLLVHQMRHTGLKPLQCEVCGFQCRQRASLKYHMTKHKAEADLEFACALCRKRFEKAHNLNVHMSMVHPLLQGGGIMLPHDHDDLTAHGGGITLPPDTVNHDDLAGQGGVITLPPDNHDPSDLPREEGEITLPPDNHDPEDIPGEGSGMTLPPDPDHTETGTLTAQGGGITLPTDPNNLTHNNPDDLPTQESGIVLPESHDHGDPGHLTAQEDEVTIPADPDNRNPVNSGDLDTEGVGIMLPPDPGNQTHTERADMSCELQSIHTDLIQPAL